ncbi:hypothetical protein BSLG_004532 [Batrachochytrium salamandrivorans]|nr:hypothetical protein BASA60_008635 [Batrachochytrium salamandrivorans]KAH9245183.1 hypothetical protein BASA81_017360 [Batrachochytrium salamandrivorans]KAJ1341062.1 hypothetical protein BSLG_004532 [Batrachochytrium salamandrivorans]
MTDISLPRPTPTSNTRITRVVRRVSTALLPTWGSQESLVYMTKPSVRYRSLSTANVNDYHRTYLDTEQDEHFDELSYQPSCDSFHEPLDKLDRGDWDVGAGNRHNVNYFKVAPEIQSEARSYSYSTTSRLQKPLIQPPTKQASWRSRISSKLRSGFFMNSSKADSTENQLAIEADAKRHAMYVGSDRTDYTYYPDPDPSLSLTHHYTQSSRISSSINTPVKANVSTGVAPHTPFQSRFMNAKARAKSFHTLPDQSLYTADPAVIQYARNNRPTLSVATDDNQSINSKFSESGSKKKQNGMKFLGILGLKPTRGSFDERQHIQQQRTKKFSIPSFSRRGFGSGSGSGSTLSIGSSSNGAFKEDDPKYAHYIMSTPLPPAKNPDTTMTTGPIFHNDDLRSLATRRREATAIHSTPEPILYTSHSQETSMNSPIPKRLQIRREVGGRYVDMQTPSLLKSPSTVPISTSPLPYHSQIKKKPSCIVQDNLSMNNNLTFNRPLYSMRKPTSALDLMHHQLQDVYTSEHSLEAPFTRNNSSQSIHSPPSRIKHVYTMESSTSSLGGSLEDVRVSPVDTSIPLLRVSGLEYSFDDVFDILDQPLSKKSTVSVDSKTGVGKGKTSKATMSGLSDLSSLDTALTATATTATAATSSSACLARDRLDVLINAIGKEMDFYQEN